MKMTTSRAILALAAALLTASVPAAFGAGKGHAIKTLTARPQLVPASRGADPNIKSPLGPNVKGQHKLAPASKGGPKARGGYEYTAHIDNHTPLTVQCYTYYCKAVFTDGSYLKWQSEATTGSSTFQLTPASGTAE